MNEFSAKDLEQLQARGISVEKAEAQLECFRTGFPQLDIVAPASTKKGILAPKKAEQEQYIAAWQSYLEEGHKILKFVNKYYQENRVAPTISEVAAGVGVARSTTHRYIQELSDRDLLDYGRGILSAPESAKMKTAYIAAPLVGSIYCGSPEEEEENVEEYVSLPVSLFGKGDFYILRAKGDSMVDAGIAEGDLLVIERNCPASEGDIVVALDQEQQNTLKRYVGFDNNEKCFILAYENEARYPGEVIKLKSFEVQGVARHVIKAL